eukprot:scaffold535_cov260-Pinguiococcus_pyrenoidosus.AAC.19
MLVSAGEEIQGQLSQGQKQHQRHADQESAATAHGLHRKLLVHARVQVDGVQRAPQKPALGDLNAL